MDEPESGRVTLLQDAATRATAADFPIMLIN